MSYYSDLYFAIEDKGVGYIETLSSVLGVVAKISNIDGGKLAIFKDCQNIHSYHEKGAALKGFYHSVCESGCAFKVVVLHDTNDSDEEGNEEGLDLFAELCASLSVSVPKEKKSAEQNALSFSFPHTIILTPEDIDDIICTAHYGGISYWCDGVRYDGSQKKTTAECLLSGGGVQYHLEEEFEDGVEEYTLTLEKLVKGVQMYVMDWVAKPKSFYCILDGECGIDTANIDAEVADCIIQYALFDDIIFG